MYICLTCTLNKNKLDQIHNMFVCMAIHGHDINQSMLAATHKINVYIDSFEYKIWALTFMRHACIQRCHVTYNLYK